MTGGIIMACTCDIAGQVRGKGFPADQWEARQRRGLGWTPTNLMITAFGPIGDTPWGSFGDLLLIPDPAAKVRVPLGAPGSGEHFAMGYIREMDGSPWSCCPRYFLKSALDALEAEYGLRLVAAFEHEFFYSGGDSLREHRYGLEAYRRQGDFGERLFDALAQAGCEPETFMAEYGVGQYEATVAPAVGMAAADRAVFLRELTRAVARHGNETASFVPKAAPDKVGNGVHIHMSLIDGEGRPVNHDPAGDQGLSERLAQFSAGIVAQAPALAALTAPSVISYLRLVPHTWSAAWNNLGFRDREACLRICPVVEGAMVEETGADPAAAFNVEFRAADATASPYIALGALVWAGLDGLRQGMPCPPVTSRDPATLEQAERSKLGLRRLPQSLPAALEALSASEAAKRWMGPVFHDAYLRHKGFEASLMADLSPEEQCQAYSEVY